MDIPTPAPNFGAPDLSADLEADPPVLEQQCVARLALEEARDEAAADERQRLAQALHDTVAQSLTAIYFAAKGIEMQLSKGDSGLVGKMASLGDMIHHASAELHACMQGLDPDRLPLLK